MGIPKTVSARRLAVSAAVVALFVAVLAQMAVPISTESAIFDETLHVTAGYVGLATGDLDLNPEHPPLAKGLAALPLLAASPRIPTRTTRWDDRGRWWLAFRFLYRANDGDRLLQNARWMMAGLTATLAVLLFLSARRLFGPTTGFAVAVAAAFDPGLLSHGHFVATDVPAALSMLATVLAFLSVGRRADPLRVLVLGLLLGVSLATKFSAVLLLPILLLLGAVRATTGGPLPYRLSRRGERSASTVGTRAVVLGSAMALAGIVAWGTVWAAYGFRYEAIRTPGHRWALSAEETLPDPGAARTSLLFAKEWRALPESYLVGFGYALRHSRARDSFLAGRRSVTGWWWYFPFAIAVKTPLPILLLGLAGFGLLGWRAIRGPDRFLACCFVVPPVFLLAVAMLGSLNIGYRHVLPIVPYLAIAAAVAADRLVRRGLPGRLVAGAAAAWLVGGSLAIAPHYLAYFNETVGGPENGHRYLVDSNVDWGQDLANLARFARERGIPVVYLAYFGQADPGYYGLRYVCLPSYHVWDPPVRVADAPREPGTWIAVSVTLLEGLYTPDPATYEWLRDREPVASIGHSILVYRL